MKEEILADYQITSRTMALLSVAHMEYSTIVLEVDRQLFVRLTPIQIIKASCLDGGSTYDGRRSAVTHHTGSKQKVPIPIIPHDDIYAFPTHSPTAFGCNWLFFNHVKYISTFTPPGETSRQSSITFHNGQSITLNESHYVLNKQMERTAMCILCFAPKKLTRV